MNTDKLAGWLQIVGNLGIIGGLVLVAVQINQNTAITRAELTARSYEAAMQFNLAMMGENPSAAVAKAATEPSSLTDEDLLVIANLTWNWWNHDSRYEILLDHGLVDDQDWDRFIRAHARNFLAGTPVAKAMWENTLEHGFSRKWERIAEDEIRRTEPTAYADLLVRLRSAADEASPQ
jgi:hypothetical protein